MLLDANVLLRYILNDHPELSTRAKEIIQNSDDVFAPNEVIAEVVYVLSSVYKVERGDVEKMLNLLMNDVSFSDRKAMTLALSYFSETKLDFVDCIIAAEHISNGTEISSFDKKLINFIKSKE